MSNIAVGTRRQYAEQSLKWDAAVASEKSDDELLQRIWNLSEDSLHVIAALTAAEAEVARLKNDALLAGSLLDYCIGFMLEIPDPYALGLRQKLEDARAALGQEKP